MAVNWLLPCGLINIPITLYPEHDLQIHPSSPLVGLVQPVLTRPAELPLDPSSVLITHHPSSPPPRPPLTFYTVLTSSTPAHLSWECTSAVSAVHENPTAFPICLMSISAAKVFKLVGSEMSPGKRRQLQVPGPRIGNRCRVSL